MRSLARYMKIVPEKGVLFDDSGGDVDRATEHLFDFKPRYQRLEIAPRTREALKRAGRSERGVPHEQVQRHRPYRRPLESGRDDARARLEMTDDVGNRVARAHDVVREMKERRVGCNRYRSFLDRRRNEHNVAPVVLGRPRTRPLEHLGALLNSDDRAASADQTLQRGKTQSGAAADIENLVAALQAQQIYRALSHGFEQRQLEVVDPRARAILSQRGGAIRRKQSREPLQSR